MRKHKHRDELTIQQLGKKDLKLQNKFGSRLIIIDEVHNIRMGEDKEKLIKMTRFINNTNI